MRKVPEFRTVDVHDPPSECYLRTGRMIGFVQTMTREELERMYPSRSLTEQSPEKPHERNQKDIEKSE